MNQNEQMSLDEYKKKVEECLRKIGNHTEMEVKSLISENEKDLQWLLDKNCQPLGAANLLLNPLW